MCLFISEFISFPHTLVAEMTGDLMIILHSPQVGLLFSAHRRMVKLPIEIAMVEEAAARDLSSRGMEFPF